MSEPSSADAGGDRTSGVRTFDVDGLTIADVVRAKRRRTVSVCIPCKDEGATIGPLVQLLADALVGDAGLVDELIVLDDGSTDDTAAVAAAAGAAGGLIASGHAAHAP